MSGELTAINPWMILPFGLLLLMIAIGPLLFEAWWQKHYPKVTFVLALAPLAYYFLELHAAGRVWHTAHEYLSFICLIGSLYVAAGGVHIGIKGRSSPFVNALFLLVGAVLANFLGTTGASMLLIRPWIRMNRHRVRAYHIVFFIFIVSNVGGCLTPIGDPPLFLGYLLGVPFWWVARNCLAIWSVGVGILLLIFLALDFHHKAGIGADSSGSHEESGLSWRFEGLPNVFFLMVILGAVFIESPVFLREILMILAALGSWFTTRKSVHDANHFNFHPIQEVAILFIGIFATMMPALDWLQANSGRLEHATPSLFYWGCGAMSGALDNAPTYLCFIKSIFGHFIPANSDIVRFIAEQGASAPTVQVPHAAEILQTIKTLQQNHWSEFVRGRIGTERIQMAYLLSQPRLSLYVLAVSIGSVFFGAGTYIGNGPNFMVKSIAAHQNVPVPGFLGYVLKYTLPFLLPVLLVVWWLFFRG